MKLRPNHAFILDYIKKNVLTGMTLDYGCGAGEIVRSGIEEGLNIYGCDANFTKEQEMAVAGLMGKRILGMNDGKIPFPDNSFDCVVNNQVLEHVKDLDSVLAEMHRVLKPNGRLLTLCPSSEVIYEGHCGVPLVHKLSKYKRLGYCWLLTFRALGFGYFKMGKPIRKWARDVQGWLNDKCFYRSRDEILDCLGKHGLPPIGIEREYLRFRSLPLTPWMLRQIFGLVLESKKGNTADTLVLRSASPVEITDAVASRVAAFLG